MIIYNKTLYFFPHHNVATPKKGLGKIVFSFDKWYFAVFYSNVLESKKCIG